MAIHHVDDEVVTLARIRSLLEPRGLVCVLERADPMVVRFAHDLGRPGIWDRLQAAQSAWFEGVRDQFPSAMNADAYPSMLAAAGLDVMVERTLTGTVELAYDAAMHQFIARHLQRTAKDLARVAAASDVAALAEFAAELLTFSDRRWSGAAVTTSRKLHIARRRSVHARSAGAPA